MTNCKTALAYLLQKRPIINPRPYVRVLLTSLPNFWVLAKVLTHSHFPRDQWAASACLCQNPIKNANVSGHSWSNSQNCQRDVSYKKHLPSQYTRFCPCMASNYASPHLIPRMSLNGRESCKFVVQPRLIHQDLHRKFLYLMHAREEKKRQREAEGGRPGQREKRERKGR